MPAIPQGAFAVYKLRADDSSKNKVARVKSNTEEMPQFPFSNKKRKLPILLFIKNITV